ncbi:MAG: T9SS type A sorting domain-containing protein [Bacteroidota bacterium]
MNRICTILALLLAIPILSVQAATFNVTNNIVFSDACTPGTVYDASFTGTVASITINVTHDINGFIVGSPTLHNTLNNNTWRYIRFDIIDVSTGTSTGTVTKLSRFIDGANYAANPGPATGSQTYTLTGIDLINEGLVTGDYRIEARVDYDMFGNSPHFINVTTQLNGGSSVTVPNAEGNQFGRSLGQLNCFDYVNCQNDGIWNVQCFPTTGGQYCFFQVIIPNGSGNYTYSWRSFSSGQTSTGSFFFMYIPNGVGPELAVTITDNVTGCVYTLFIGGKQSTAALHNSTLSNEISVYPNPVAPSSELNLAFGLRDNEVVNVQIFDLTGRLIAEPATAQAYTAGSHELKIVTPTVSGSYFVRLTTESGLVLTEKVLVN